MKTCISLCLFLFWTMGFSQILQPTILHQQTQASSYQLPTTKSIIFEENKGQWDSLIKFRAKTGTSVCQILSNALSFGYLNPQHAEPLSVGEAHCISDTASKKNNPNPDINSDGFVWNLEFVNPSALISLKPVKLMEQVNHYYKGKDLSDWAIDCKNSRELLLENVWHHTDIHLYSGAEDALEYDIILHPGSDLEQVQFFLNTPLSTALLMDGSLQIQTPFGMVKKSKPCAFQMIEGKKIKIDCSFELEKGLLSFKCETYNPSFDLIIDPLVWSTWISGVMEGGYVYDIAADAAGNTYITGYCTSFTFPTLPGSFQSTYSGNNDDAIITKIKPDGSNILFTAFISGDNRDQGRQIFYEAPYIYMSGSTQSGNLPMTSGAYDTTLNGYWDAFYVKLTENGKSLVQSSYIGGSLSEFNSALFVKDQQVIIGGRTSSNDFVASSGSINTGNKGFYDIFIFKYDTKNKNLILSHLIGGNGEDMLYSLFEDKGKIYLGGYTSSGNLATTAYAYSKTLKGNSDGFIAQIDASNNQLLYSTYFGGSGMDVINGIYVEFDRLYLTGYTSSNNLPVSSTAYQTTLISLENAFVLKFSIASNIIHYCTYLGNFYASGSDLVVKNGFALVIGTTSNGKKFPQSELVSNQNNLASYDVFIAGLNLTGSKLTYSTVVGGGANDYYPAIARNQCHVYASVTSHSPEFPTTQNAFIQNKPNNSEDAMLVFQLDLKETPQSGAKPRKLKTKMNLCVSKGKITLNTGIKNTIWSTGEMDSFISISKTGIYHAYIYSACDSIYHDSCIVDSLSTDIHLGRDTLFCRKPFTFKLNAFTDSCKWSTGDTSKSITVNEPGIYWVYSTAFCSTKNTDSINIKYVDEDSILILPMDSVLCNGDTVNLYSQTDSTFWSSGEQGKSIAVSQAGIYWAKAYNRCHELLLDTFVYDTLIAPTLKLRNDTLICQKSVLLDLLSPYKNSRWSTGGTGKAIQISKGGTYWGETRDICGHVSRDSFTLDLDTSVFVLELPNDTVFCGSNFTYTLKSKNQQTFWSDGTTGQSITVNQPGLYIGKNTNKCQQVSRDSILLSLIEVPEIKLPRDTVICGLFSILLDGYYDKTVWSGSTANRYFTINKPGLYTAYYKNQCGISIDTFNVLKDTSTLPFFIPNAFTPDGNGLNEFFPPSTDHIADFHLSIFNTWGQKIYEGTSSWDGKFMDAQVMQGVYMWLVTYRDCNKTRYYISGSVTLLK